MSTVFMISQLVFFLCLPFKINRFKNAIRKLLTWINVPGNLDIIENISGLTIEQKTSISILISIFEDILDECRNLLFNPSINKNNGIPQISTPSFFEMAYKIQQRTQHFDRTQQTLTAIYPSLNSMTLDFFQSKCIEPFSIIRGAQKIVINNENNDIPAENSLQTYYLNTFFY